MIASNYVTQGLKTIDSLYFAVFNPCVNGGMSNRKGRWQVRKWVGNRPLRFDLWDCYGHSEVIMTICKEEMTDMGLIDAGYEEIDGRVVSAIRESNYWKADYKRKIEEMDWRNERKRRLADAQLDYESKCAAKSIWRNYHEPTVHLSGRDWKV